MALEKKVFPYEFLGRAAIVIKLTGEATASNDIVQEKMVLTWYGL